MEIIDREMDAYFDLLGDETKFGIILSLEMYGSLNLKHIANCVGKSEPAVLRQLKLLTNMNIIKLDQEESTRSWGKYYQLSPKGKELFLKSNKWANESEIPSTVAWYKKTALAIKSLSTFNHNIAKFASNVIVEDAPRLVELEKKTKEGNYGDAMIFAMTQVLLKTKKDVKEYLTIIDEFREKLKKFRLQPDDTAEPNQILYLSSIPIQAIHPLPHKRELDTIYKEKKITKIPHYHKSK